MTNYSYRARDSYGAMVSGQMEAESDKIVAQQLSRQGFSPVAITVAASSGLNLQLTDWFDSVQKLKPQELIVFTRQLASTLEAGVPLVNSLEAVSDQIKNRKFQAVVLQVVKDIQEGMTFSDALAKHGIYFSALIINMIRAGEKAGILPQVLDRISNIIEKDQETSDKIKAATRYPIIVTVVLGLAFIVLSVYVLPRFQGFFTSFNTELPLPTRILMGINFAMTNYWYWLVIGLIAGGVGLSRFLGSEQGRLAWDRFILSTPVMGELYLKIYLSRFGRMLAAMLSAGIPILDALQITSATVENKIIARIILDIRSQVSQGKNLAEPMRGSRYFPTIATSMVAIGEKAGNLENMLSKMSDYFDREIDYTIKNITPLLEPIMIFGLAAIMLLFALGILLPMWDVTRIYKGM